MDVRAAQRARMRNTRSAEVARFKKILPLFLGFEPAYLVEFFKVGQVTWFCTKLGQLTWICKILDQVTWSAQFAQGQITWFLEFEGQVT